MAVILTPIHGSSLIKAVGYDETAGNIHVQFLDDKAFAYSATKEYYNALLAASSKGQYFNAVIKKFPSKRISDGPAVTPITSGMIKVATPVYLALLKTKKALGTKGTNLPYYMWLACGGGDENALYQKCISVFKLSSGMIGKEHLDVAIQWAKDKKL